MQAGLHRYLVEWKFPQSILSDTEFKTSCDVLGRGSKDIKRERDGQEAERSQSLDIRSRKDVMGKTETRSYINRSTSSYCIAQQQQHIAFWTTG